MWLGLLGPLDIRHGDTAISVPAGKQRVVLAALLVRANQVVSFDELADVLWDGTPTAGARATVRNYVKRLRQTLGTVVAARIATRDPGYLIELDDDELDLLRFDKLCQGGRAAAARGAWEQGSGMLDEAIRLWRGAPLVDIPSEMLHHEQAPRWHELRLQATEWRIEADLHLGRHAQLVPELRALASAHPLREHFHAQLMLALARCGRQAEALDAYRQARRVLVEELGVEPAAELRRLQQQILTGELELIPSAPASAASQPAGSDRAQVVPRQLPTAVRHFIGRAGELKELTALLDELDEASGTAGAVLISAIGGTAGVGKTALAVHWAHQVAGRFPDGQLYVNLRGFDPADTPVAPEQAIRGFLDALAVPAERIPADPDAQAGLYRSLLAGKRMLIVLDNARDAAQVRPLLPASPTCLAVVTSRRQLTGLVAAHNARLLNLDVLTDAEAGTLLAGRLGPERIAANPQAAADLTRLCARLPLALTVTAARAAARPSFPLAALAAELEDARGRLDALDAGDPATDVRAVFSWSYRQLGQPAARMFRLLGLHPGPDITAPAAASLAAAPVEQARVLLAELAEAHLLTEHRPGRYAFHDLLGAYATELARAHDGDGERRAAQHRFLDHYLHSAYGASLVLDPRRDPLTLTPALPGTAPEHFTDHQQAMAWFEAEHQVLLAATAQAAAAGWDTIAWQLPWALGTFFDRRGHWHDLVTTQQCALAAAARTGDATAQARSHASLAYPYILLGRHQDAHAHLRQTLTLYQQLGDHHGQARAHNRFSRLLETQNRHREALDHNERALELFRITGNRAEQARTLNSIGWHHTNLGNHRQAIGYCQRALALLSELGDRSGQAATWDSLGHAHHHLGHQGEAITCYQRALDLARDLGDRFHESQALRHLGETHRAAGNREAARDAWRQALAILEDLQHPDADEVRATLDGLAGAGRRKAQESERGQQSHSSVP